MTVDEVNVTVMLLRIVALSMVVTISCSVLSAGAVYVFSRSGQSWNQQGYIKASNPGENDFFGWSVALSGDGATLAVGSYLEDSSAAGINGNQQDNAASNAGAVYMFSRADTGSGRRNLDRLIH